MTRSPRARLLKAGIPLVAALLAMLLSAQSVLAAVGWTAPVGAGPAYSWAMPRSLGRTVTTAGTAWLHTVYTSDRIGTTFVTDSGPYAGVYYRRVKSTSTTFGTATRLSPSDEHGYNAVLATAGSYVYVAWIHQDHYVTSTPAEERLLRFRANRNHGSSSAWSTIGDLTTDGRAGRVSIAAAGAFVYVAWTDGDTGDIKLATSPDHGATWSTASVGTTDRPPDASGYAAGATVAAAGTNVVVAWLMDGGAVDAVVSTNNAGAFGSVADISPGPSANVSAAALGSRIAIAFTSEAGVALRIWNAGSWGPMRGIAAFDAGLTYKAAGFGSSVALFGSAGVAVAWAACRRADCTASSRTGEDLRWRESTTNGRTWKTAVTIASYAASSSRRYNDGPTVVMPSASKRYVAWTAFSAGNSTYRVLYRRGTGTP